MRVAGLQLLTASLSTSVRILFPCMTTVTSVPTAISHVVDDGFKTGHQDWVEQLRLSGRDEPPAHAFTSPTSVIQTPGIHAPQKRDARDCIGIYLCTEGDWKGDCYWSCFRKGVETYLEADWAPKIKSARPDLGAKCIFFFGTECRSRHKTQHMVYPGGDFDAGKLGKLGVGCFYCMTLPGLG
ncbi:hypothetical protein LZ30DRAFT_782526 [Colletotrichum cereale]|nr:hypothetical protein LZ30DRAFT_782526 [Colletotrichum cereale]